MILNIIGGVDGDNTGSGGMAYAMDLKFMADNACGFESHLPDMPAMAIASSGVDREILCTGHTHTENRADPSGNW